MSKVKLTISAPGQTPVVMAINGDPGSTPESLTGEFLYDLLYVVKTAQNIGGNNGIELKLPERWVIAYEVGTSDSDVVSRKELARMLGDAMADFDCRCAEYLGRLRDLLERKSGL